MQSISNNETKKTVLVVDDSPNNLSLISDLLKNTYQVKVANSGWKAIKIAFSENVPDIILLDIMMPEMDGYEVCVQLKSNKNTANIPIIFLTARTDVQDEERGFALGAADYLTKPISPSILLTRIQTQLEFKKMQDYLRNQNRHLEVEVGKRTTEVTALQDVMIHILAYLAETRDNDTGNHIRRTQHYVKILAEHLRNHPRFSDYLNSNRAIETLFKSAPLHDIGKVAIPDSILLKPGRLDAEEFKVMKTHTTIGRDIIVKAEQDLGVNIPFLQTAKEIAYSHQEKWDGSGYPEGLLGDNIPISARLMALADVYDALKSRRVYKEPMSDAEVREIMEVGRGTHFDPDVVDAFFEQYKQFKEIEETYKD